MASTDLDALAISFTRDFRTVVVSVRGEVDGVTAPTLQRALSDVIDGQGSLSLRLDLAELTFIDSTGLAVLARALRHIRDRGGNITITNPSRSVRKVFDVVGFTQLFRITSPGTPG